MTDLEPCLAGCDAALAEAELLLVLLGADAATEAELAPVRLSILALRREVDRLRGMPAGSSRKRIHPDWLNIAGSGTPWTISPRDAAGEP